MANVPGTRAPDATDEFRPAIEDVTQVAAPVLAGFSITLVALMVTARTDVRLAGPALLAAVVSTVSQLISVQCGAWARQYHSLRQASGSTAAHANKSAYDGHVTRARLLYGIGVVTLLLAMGMAVVPGEDTNDAGWRWAAVTFLGTVAVLQVGWGRLVVWGRKRPKGRFGRFARGFIYDDQD